MVATQGDSQSPKVDWSRLTRQQLGQYAEYFAKMEFTLLGFDVFTAEVDDKGIDFVLREPDGHYYDVQVKSLRAGKYVFIRKSVFAPRSNLFLALAIFVDGKSPDLYLIPSTVWLRPVPPFVSRDYEGRKSQPEWGIQLSARSRPHLEPYRFDRIAKSLRVG